MAGNYERLSAEDASFLYEESPTAPMHVGSLAVFEDAGADFGSMVEHVRSRLHLVPRFRKKLMWVPFGQGLPVWVDDADFDIGYHVRHTAVPAPGGERELLALAARVLSLPLDRDRPLWEIWVADMPDGRLALLQKTHHCLVDGISGVDLATVLLDLQREGADMPDAPEWEPQPPPTSFELLARTAQEGLAKPLDVARGALRSAMRPAETIRQAGDLARGIESFSAASLRSAPATSLNRQVGGSRRFEVVRARLDDAKAVKNRFGATVNDVVLAVTAGGLGHLLRSRGEDPTGLVMKVVVPVSLRGEDGRGSYGNQVAAMSADFPVGESDPVRCLDLVHVSTKAAKESGQALGADLLVQLSGFAPPTFLSLAMRAVGRQRMYNLCVTNVPGPQFPLYLLGGEMLEVFPYVLLQENTDVGAAILSYNGQLDFGLIGDWETVPDLAVWAEGIDKAMRELVAAT